MCTAAETGYSFDKIKLLELEGARNQGSPGRSLLWELGSRNTTVRQLYGYLSTLSRYREMKILEDYGECWKTLSGCGVFCVVFLFVLSWGGSVPSACCDEWNTLCFNKHVLQQ